MYDLFLIGLSNAMQWNNIMYVVLGLIIGNIVGATPGLTPTMAVAIGLPITFVLPPIPSIVFLIGIAKGGTSACGLTAIAIGVPGIPAATCTVLDGYPLMKQGKGLKAMTMAVFASTTGDFFTDVILILTCAPLAIIAIKYIGPMELTALFIFSLTFVGSVSGDQPIKGLIAAAIGLFVATVGMDRISGSSRLTFGLTSFMGGFSIIPLLIGLFAIPEILDQVEKLATSKKQIIATIIKSNNPDDNRVTRADFHKCFLPILKGGVIGLMSGIIPGLGSSVGSFLSYGETVRASKHPEKFGKGALEGVAASESANAAVNGANLIPLLTLGIPSETVAAALLGAFVIQGLTPGHLLIQQHGETIYTIFAVMLIANALNYFIGTQIMIKGISFIVDTSTAILVPLIAVLCVFGSYAINNRMFDVKVMAIFGAIGYFMNKYDYPRAPMIIAVLLSPMLEGSFRRSLLITDGNMFNFVKRPIVFTFLSLTILTVFIIYKRLKKIS